MLLGIISDIYVELRLEFVSLLIIHIHRFLIGYYGFKFAQSEVNIGVGIQK